MNKFLCVLVLSAAHIWSTVLLAAEKPPAKTQPAAAEIKTAESTTKDAPKAEEVKIPDWMHAKGLELNVDKTNVDLSTETIMVTPTLEPVAVELYDEGGRLIDFKREYYDKDIFNELKVRNMRLAIGLGSVNSTDSAAWKKIFLSGDRFQVATSFEWFLAGSLGLDFTMKLHTQSNELDEGVSVSYTGLLLGTALLYEFVPFKHAKNYFRKIAIAPALGIFYGSHNLRMSDDLVNINDEDKSIGYSAGAKLRFPMANNFSMTTEWFLMHQKIEFSKFDTKIEKLDNSMILGGSYAF